eukprot:1159968-Pelagomonas_calceolata.AAC.3
MGAMRVQACEARHVLLLSQVWSGRCIRDLNRCAYSPLTRLSLPSTIQMNAHTHTHTPAAVHWCLLWPLPARAVQPPLAGPARPPAAGPAAAAGPPCQPPSQP